MPVNDTKEFLYVTPTGQVYSGDSPPSGSTVLVAPGGTISDELAERYGIADKLGADPAFRTDDAGNPIVVRGGKAIAADLLPQDDEESRGVREAAGKEDEAKVLRASKASARRDVEPAGAVDEPADDEDESADEPGPKVKAAGKAIRLGQDGVEDKSVAGPRDAKSARKK